MHTPQATVHSSLVAEAWLAWHSIQRSMMWFLQIAQLSTTMSTTSKTNKLIHYIHIWVIGDNYPATCLPKSVVSTNQHQSFFKWYFVQVEKFKHLNKNNVFYTNWTKGFKVHGKQFLKGGPIHHELLPNLFTYPKPTKQQHSTVTKQIYSY